MSSGAENNELGGLTDTSPTAKPPVSSGGKSKRWSIAAERALTLSQSDDGGEAADIIPEDEVVLRRKNHPLDGQSRRNSTMQQRRSSQQLIQDISQSNKVFICLFI